MAPKDVPNFIASFEPNAALFRFTGMTSGRRMKKARGSEKKGDQPIELIHVSDIHFGSGEAHGKVNPATGLNVRLEDFTRAFAKCVDYALSLPADVFLFTGDAYRNASPEPIYQKMFAEQLRRLSEAGVQTVLVVGNHDQIFKSTASHSMSVFQSLGVPNLLIIDRPKFWKIDTAHGALQLLGLPYVTRHLLMTNEEYGSLSGSAIDRVLGEHIRSVVSDLYDQIDPSVPAVMSAHMMVDGARAVAEQELLVGYTQSFPLSLFTDSRLDYVALGHVHKHQILQTSNPAVVYCGSIERVDFSEEGEDKGFVHVSVARESTSFKFVSIDPRPFITVDVDCTDAADATAAVISAVSPAVVEGCVLRVRYKIREEQTALFDQSAVLSVASAASMVHLKPEVIVAQRESRIPSLTESTAVTPLSALETYLDNVAPERKERLMSRASDLISKLHDE
jgi:DNA repair protein SbcD/Mre11